MATLLSAIRTRVRTELREPTASYWSDTELLDHILAGVRDLWRAVGPGAYQKFHFTVDETNVSLAANATQLTGVPADVGVVVAIEPRTLAGRSGPIFKKASYTGAKFQLARAMSAQDASQLGVIFYDVTGPGAPVSAPIVRVAPLIQASLPLRLCYIPTLDSLTAASANPIPGESDQAVFAWTMAHARAKEREDRTPDPNWLALYATEKANIINAVVPRHEDTEAEDDVVEPMFETEW